LTDDQLTPEAALELKEAPELDPPREPFEDDPWTELFPRELFEPVAAIGAETLLAWGAGGSGTATVTG
jgi:hypothetical protein